MDIWLSHLDWSRVRSFLAVAEEGSLSGAARALGRSQPTLGRDIHALEQALGADLFLRRPRGLVLSETGEIDLPAMMRALFESGYDGPVSIEHESHWFAGDTRSGAQVLKDGLSDIRRLCEAALGRQPVA